MMNTRSSTMTKVTILPVPDEHGDVSYHALAGDKQSEGKTAGEALDSLTTQVPEDETGTLIIIQKSTSQRIPGSNAR